MKRFGIGVVLLSSSLLVYASNDDVARQINQIETLLAQDAFAQAAELAKAIRPTDAALSAQHQRLLGYIYLQEQDYDNAYAAYKKALSYQTLPESLKQDVMGALVSLSMKRGRADLAVRYGRNYLLQYPRFQPVENLYTRALFSEKQYAEALKQANAIIARYPSAPEYIWQIKLLSEEQLKQHRALINTARNIQDIFGHDLRWQRKHAAAYAGLGEYEQAIKILQDEAKAGQALTEADYLAMAQYASRRGDASKAMDVLNKGLSEETLSESRDVLKQKLQILIQSKQWQEAWVLVSALNQQPELPLLKAQIQLASRMQRWPDILRLSQQAIDMGGSRDPFFWEMLGFSAMKTDDLDRAQQAYQRLQSLAPDSDAAMWLETLELMKKP